MQFPDLRSIVIGCICGLLGKWLLSPHVLIADHQSEIQVEFYSASFTFHIGSVDDFDNDIIRVF